MTDEANKQAEEYSPSSRIDLLIKVINRYDTYITSTNAKASLVIAWNGVLIGSIILKYQEIISQFSCMCMLSSTISILLVMCGLFALLSTGLIFGVVFPFLVPSNSEKGSLIFFGSVAKLKPHAYIDAMSSVSSKELVDDLANQASVLAVGLNAKMRRLQQSIWAIYAELLMIALMLILYAFNLEVTWRGVL